MALQMALSKADNLLYTDFSEAYWTIDDIVISNGMVSFAFNAWPSREARLVDRQMVAPTLAQGGPTGLSYKPLLHQWLVSRQAASIFPNGMVPADEASQRAVLYDWIKAELELDAVDILE